MHTYHCGNQLCTLTRTVSEEPQSGHSGEGGEDVGTIEARRTLSLTYECLFVFEGSENHQLVSQGAEASSHDRLCLAQRDDFGFKARDAISSSFACGSRGTFSHGAAEEYVEI